MAQLVGRYEMVRYAERKRQFADEGAQHVEPVQEYMQELDLPDILDRAMKWFTDKKIISKLEFIKLAAEERWRSFTVAKVGDQEILDKIKAKLTEAMESGIEIDDFRQDIDKVFDSVGVSKLNPFHLDTVYLTNAMSGYGEGRKQVVDSLSVDEFPMRQVVTVGDDRVRDPHRELDGFTAPKDDSVWEWLKTPFSYRCRCMIVPVHISEGLSASGSLPDVRGRKGFEFLN